MKSFSSTERTGKRGGLVTRMTENNNEERQLISYRATAEEKYRLKELALRHRMSVQELITTAIAKLEAELAGTPENAPGPLSEWVQVPVQFAPTIRDLVELFAHPLDRGDEISRNHITALAGEYVERRDAQPRKSNGTNGGV